MFTEIEGKWRLSSHEHVAQLRSALRELGAERIGLEREVNELFDRPRGGLKRTGRLLRLRMVNGEATGRLTFKGRATRAAGLKSREELETSVADAGVLRMIVERLGFHLTLTYFKVRETWRFGSVDVALDELPFGLFCEIEGPEDEILAVANALHLTEIEPRGYPALMEEYLASTSG
jgi:adenylate cyclase class 2